jgi:DNA-binding transcriptional LysR family regulator
MTLEMNYLEHFTAAVEEGSIGKAARTLNISQPGLTRSIRMLEEQLEVTLLERSSKGVKPTDYGSSFYTRAKSILIEASRAQTEIQEMRGETEALLTIGTIPVQANFILPEATIKFLEIHKNVKLKVVQKARGEILSSLNKGEFDFIFSMLVEEVMGQGKSIEQNPDEDYITQLLFYDRASVIVRPDHPVFKSDKNVLENLSNYSWVMPRSNSDQRLYINNFFAQTGLSLPKISVECQTLPYLKNLVSKSDLVGIMTTNTICVEEQFGLIKSIPIPRAKNVVQIGVKYRADRPISKYAKSMIQQMILVCQEMKPTMSDRLKFEV